ncbi:RHS repeat-associated core domain-containing protein [Paenibacillus sp. FSL K6-1217]|uniref:RHS repeat domain-containing protein n=1 Tax=Paenibacillus sp. FSL K6-1217 TaxID=2921466 RepID=UPI00324F6219
MKISDLSKKIILFLLCFVLILPDEPMFAQTSKAVIEQKSGQTQDIDPWDSMRNPQKPVDNGQPLTTQEVVEPTPLDLPQFDDDSLAEGTDTALRQNSVVADTYESADPTQLEILKLKAKTLEKQGLLPANGASMQRGLSDANISKASDKNLSIEVIKELDLRGATRLEFYWMNLLFQDHPDWNLPEVWDWKQESGYDWETIYNNPALFTASSSLQLKRNVTSQVYQEEAQDWSPASVTSEVYNSLEVSKNSLSFAAVSMRAFDNDVDNVTKNRLQAQINQTGKPQYGDRYNAGEFVDPVTGSLSWKQNQIHLPGRDGLDLDIGIRYSSNEAMAFYTSSDYNPNFNSYDVTTSLYNSSVLGAGWSFQFPYIQKIGDYNYYYHDGNGSVYPVGDGGGLSSYTQLINYEGKDKRYIWETSVWENEFSNGKIGSKHYIEYADKRKEYFDRDGKLLGIKDRFGNTITFKYEGPNSWQLSSIVDSVGREVKFTYEDNLMNSNFNGENVSIQVFDENGRPSESVMLTKGRQAIKVNELQTYVPFLQKVTNQKGDKIYFDYQHELARYNPQGINRNYENKNYYALLKKIQFPNSSSEYSYDKVVRNLPYEDSVEEFRINSRSDHTGLKAYNQYKYTYWKDYTGEHFTQWPGHLPDGYQYSTSVIQISDSASNGTTALRVFDKDNKLLRTETQAPNGEKKVVNNTAFDPTFIHRPVKTTLSDYGVGDSEQTANHLYTETVYNEWGSVHKETSPLTWEQLNNAAVKEHYTTTYDYEPNYQFIRAKTWYQNVSDVAPRSETYTYTGDGRPAQSVNAMGEETRYSYSYDSSKVVVVQAETWANGQCVATVITRYGPESKNAYPTEQRQMQNPGGGDRQEVITKMSYDLGTGLLRKMTDGLDRVTSYEYDPLGRPTKITYPEALNGNGSRYTRTEEYSYMYYSPDGLDAFNAGTPTLRVGTSTKLTEVATGKQSFTSGETYYNGLGLPILESNWDAFGAVSVMKQYHYDDQGRPVYMMDPEGNIVTVGYDAWGRPNESKDAFGNRMIAEYQLKARQDVSYLVPADGSGNLNYIHQQYDPLGHVTQQVTYKDWPQNTQPLTEDYQYDLDGNITAYTDANRSRNNEGVTTSYRYDALGRLTSVKDALNQTTQYTYDGTGQIKEASIQALGGVAQKIFSKGFNGLSQMTMKEDPSSQRESLTYNELGQLATRTDRNGTSFTYDYDEWGQPKSVKLAGAGTVAQQSLETKFRISGSSIWDTVTEKNGGPVKATHTQWNDSLNRIRAIYEEVNWNGAVHNANITNTLDRMGRYTQVKDANLSFSTNFQYDRSRLLKVQTNGASALNGAASANAEYRYYPNGLVESITYPTLADGSRLVTRYTYNKALNWVETVTNEKSGVVLSKFDYGYDNNGNIIKVTEKRLNEDERVTAYTYDALNRLLTLNQSNGARDAYTYDVRGNRLTLESSATLSAESTETSYQYDLENTLTGLTKGTQKTEFAYYANGLRVAKATGAKKTEYNYNFNGEVISEVKSGNGASEQSNYVRGDRVLVKKEQKTGKDYYYLYNGHGDVVQIVDTTGKIVNNYVYDEWGNITSQKEEISNSFKYAGEIYDEETGLYYLRARYYDPSMGRFLNEDTVEGQIDNPLSLNLYTYVENNPLMFNDPSGNVKMRVDGNLALEFFGITFSDYHPDNTIVCRGSLTYERSKDKKNLQKHERYVVDLLLEMGKDVYLNPEAKGESKQYDFKVEGYYKVELKTAFPEGRKFKLSSAFTAIKYGIEDQKANVVIYDLTFYNVEYELTDIINLNSELYNYFGDKPFRYDVQIWTNEGIYFFSDRKPTII